MMRSAMIGAVAVLCGQRAATAKETRARRRRDRPKVPLSPDLDVVKRSKGPVMTVIDEFYKVGPGPSSSHTIGPMRITVRLLPALHQAARDQLAKRPRSACTSSAA
jgi:L-serine dehydratase